MCISYASWGPIFWPFLRNSARDLTIKAVRGTVAIKAFLTIKRASVLLTVGSVPLTGPLVPLKGVSVPLTPLTQNIPNDRKNKTRFSGPPRVFASPS